MTGDEGQEAVEEERDPERRQHAPMFANDTYSYAADTSGAGDALFPCAEAPRAGTVALTADAAGDGFAIAIALEEWRSE